MFRRRAGHALGIELFGDRARRDPGGVFLEDAADDCRLARIDPALAGKRLSARTDAAHDIIAVAVAAAGLFGFDAATQTPARLVREILEIKRSHRALQADMELVDVAFGQREDPTARKADPLEDMRDILLVTGQAVERFRDNDPEPAFQRILQQLLNAGPDQARA